MSVSSPAVHLDAAGSPSFPTAGAAHEQVIATAQTQPELHEDATMGFRQALRSMRRTSDNLESPQVQVQVQVQVAESSATGAASALFQQHHNVDVVGKHQAEAGVTVNAHDPAAILMKEETNNPNLVAPPSVVPHRPRDATPPRAPLSINTATTRTDPESPSTSKSPRGVTSPRTISQQKTAHSAGPEAAQGDKMIFGHHASTSSANRRRNFATTNAVTDYEADLTSKDRARQKQAVKNFLLVKIRSDWQWEWPRPAPDSDSSPEASPTFERQPGEQWKVRDEWLSCGSENEEDAPIPTTLSSPDTATPNTQTSPFRFESPDGVGDTIKRTAFERKRRRKKRLIEEMSWNDGLRCFTGRRDAWTGARRAPRRYLNPLRANATAAAAQRSSLSSEDGGSSTVFEQANDEDWESDTEIPIAPSLLPPDNAMRASILPAAYNTIYDKVVVQALTPSCPMNLKDVTRSCVQGWKRDGEWPPKGTVVEPAKKKGRKLSVAGLFGLGMEKDGEKVKEKDGEKSPTEKGAIRRSLQKILGLGHGGGKEEGAAP